MASSWKDQRRRGQVIEQARRLARSGLHADHATIMRELEGVDGFAAARGRMEDQAIRSQLDKLCTLAQGRRPVEAPPRASTRA